MPAFGFTATVSGATATELTGTKLDWEKFKESMKVANRTNELLEKCADLRKHTPCPLPGTLLVTNACMSGQAADPAHYALRVRTSDFGRRFGASDWPNLSLADLELCADVDRFDFAMPVARAGEHLVIR